MNIFEKIGSISAEKLTKEQMKNVKGGVVGVGGGGGDCGGYYFVVCQDAGQNCDDRGPGTPGASYIETTEDGCTDENGPYQCQDVYPGSSFCGCECH